MDEDRKRVEKALRHSESRLSAFLQSLDDIAFELDHTGVYLDVWTRDESLLFRPKEEFLGKRAVDVFDSELGRSMLEVTVRVAATGKAETIEYALLLDSGERFFSAVLTPIDSGSDGPRSVACLVRDETERHRVQVEREVLIRKLEEKNAELEQYGYTVSHDLRSPLLTIKGYLSFLVKSAAAGQLDEVREYAGEIDAAVRRMTTLIEELLELSRAGRVVKDAETLALGDLAREAAAALARSVEENGIEVSIPPDLPAVHGDRLRLIQVFQNLLENAIKFIGDTAAPRIEIGARVTREEVICSVADNGIGIDPRHRDKIFGLFDKVDSSGSGSGVGLALVKRIIDVHGGRVWVQSAGPGRGASFFFTLPRPDKAAGKAA